jgi:hypothetical protein
MFRSTVEIVVALWCDERSSLPLQSRPISAWFYLSATGDLQPVRPEDDIAVELRILTSRRTNLVTDRTRPSLVAR